MPKGHMSKEFASLWTYAPILVLTDQKETKGISPENPPERSICPFSYSRFSDDRENEAKSERRRKERSRQSREAKAEDEQISRPVYVGAAILFPTAATAVQCSVFVSGWRIVPSRRHSASADCETTLTRRPSPPSWLGCNC